MKVLVFETKQELFESLSEKYIDNVKRNPNIKLGLATGGTPSPLYEMLIEDHKLNNTSYKNVSTFNLDEYIGLDPTHEQSYHYFMNKVLFDHIDIKKENVYLPFGNVSNIQEECKRYDSLLEANPIDLQLLGIGTNAHIAFNEPGSNFNSKTIVTDLTKETLEANKRFFKTIKEVPTTAITMGVGLIMKAKEIVLVATGHNKALAIKDTVEGLITKNVPSSILQAHDNVTLYLDKEAASLLGK